MLCLAEEVDFIIVWVIVFQNPKLQLAIGYFLSNFLWKPPKVNLWLLHQIACGIDQISVC